MLPGHGVVHQHADGFLRQRLAGQVVVPAGLLDEVPGQQRDVLAPLAQRRQRDRDDVQAVVEVLAELAFLDHLAQVGVGGRDDARVELDRARLADALDLPLLERAQQLGLQRQATSGATSSMNSVPRCASSKRPTRAETAPVKAPLVWPNSSASASGSGMAAALKATKRCSARGLLWWIVRAISSLPVPVSPWISTVLFIGRDEFERREDLLHRRALADDAIEAEAVAQLRAQFGVLLPQPALFEAAVQDARELRRAGTA